MNSFTFQNPTKLIFGKGQIEQVSNEIKRFGTKVLLVYGGGSIKRNGVYDAIQNELKKINAEVFELAGVEPNPRLTTVHKGVALCKENDIDVILAAGGGSVIDAAKAIAAGAKYEADVWDIIDKKAKATAALPLGTVLTLAATGSEMNANSVITNWEKQEKLGWSSPYVYPAFSILDPVYTYSVPLDQTIYGIVDMMSHVIESYFHHVENTPLQDRFAESILQTVMDAGSKLVKDLENYELRETILLSGTLALNGTIQMGARGDWATHNIEHAVSAVYDIPHAGGLAILFPHWLRYTIKENPKRHAQFARNVFGVDPAGKTEEAVALEGIERLSQFWLELGAPAKLIEYGIDDSELENMASIAVKNGALGNYKKLNKEDVLEILRAAL